MSDSRDKKVLFMSSIDIKKMQKEREKFFKDLAEVKKLEERYYRTSDEKIPAGKNHGDNLSDTLTSISEVHPGREVFLKEKMYQKFTLDELIAKNVGLKSRRMTLQLKMLPMTYLPKPEMKHLFYIMSLDQDYIVSESCLIYLSSHVNYWAPQMKQIINVFFNWGATCKSLKLTSFEISIVFNKEVFLMGSKNKSILPTFCSFNHEHIFSYLKTVLLKSNIYTDTEILILFKVLINISLDKSNLLMFDIMKKSKLIGICVDSIKNWDPFKVVTVAKYIYDDGESYHNQIAIACTILPKTAKCNDLKSCLSFAILNSMVYSQKKFDFPNEDEELLPLVQNIKTFKSYDDLYQLYLIVYLVNYIICARNIAGKNAELLGQIEDSFDKLKLEVTRKHKSIDVNLLKGRIDYCSAIWALFSHKEEQQS